MFIKRITYVRYIVVVMCCSNVSPLLVAMDGAKGTHTMRRPHAHQNSRDIDVSLAVLRADKAAIKKYVTERVANDLKKAKRWGKGMAKAFGGITSYVFDAIPFEFFADNASVEQVFKRLEEGLDYIRNLKETFKKNTLGNKKKINQSQLAEFLYCSLVDKLSISDANRALLKKEPIKMDEFVRKGIVNRSEYMYYTLLNFAVRYYLEQELKHR
jgi:hypothetical protein